MKKQTIVVIVNILLVVAVLGGVIFAMVNAGSTVKFGDVFQQGATEKSTDDTKQEILFKLGIVQHTDNEDCNACYQGFIAGLASRGYVNNHNIDITYIKEENSKKCDQKIKEMVDSKVDIIYTIGAYSTKKAAELTKDIPIIFAALPDPEKEGLVKSNEEPGGNVTGVSSFVPTFEQIDSIKVLLPKAKSVGAIYNPTDETSVVQTLIAKKESEEDNINLKYSKYAVNEADELSAQFDKILKDKIDVLYLPVDKTINKNIKKIIDFANKNKLPTICGNEDMLKKGGFSTTVTDFTSMGKKAAELVIDVAINGKSTSNMAVVYKYDCDTIVNEKAAKNIGVKITEDIAEQIELKSY